MWRSRAKLLNPDSLGRGSTKPNWTKLFKVLLWRQRSITVCGQESNCKQASYCDSLYECEKFDLERQKILHGCFSLVVFCLTCQQVFADRESHLWDLVLLVPQQVASEHRLFASCSLIIWDVLLLLCMSEYVMWGVTMPKLQADCWVWDFAWVYQHPFDEIKLPVQWNRYKAEKIEDGVPAFAWSKGLHCTDVR